MRLFKNIWEKNKSTIKEKEDVSYNQLVIEIGAGVGLHPIQYAKEHADTQVIAIERTTNKFLKMKRRFESHSLNNLFCIHEDAVSYISRMVEQKTVDIYFILYPNPYPKPSQKNKRFPCMPFFAYLIETLKENGKIIFATNCLSYKQDILDSLDIWKSLKLKKMEKVDAACYRTHFEKKYLARNDLCYTIELIKRS